MPLRPGWLRRVVMTTPSQLRAADSARAVSDAALGVLRRVRADDPDTESAVDRLELQLRLAAEEAVQGFEDESTVTEADLLATAASQLGIGLTALSAEVALSTPRDAATLESSSQDLGRLADALERPPQRPDWVQGFDADGAQPAGLADAAAAALDRMTSVAASVVTVVLDKALKPLVAKVPDGMQATLADWDIPGRIARWGLRAIRRSLDLLSRLIDSAAIERLRKQIDDVLSRLGQGEDRTVVAGWAIGADAVRAIPSVERSADGRAIGVRQLAELSERFDKLCDLLRRIAGLIVSIGPVLALLSVPHAGLIVPVGLILVVGAVLMLGRDYTGATDLPGSVLGVRLILEGKVDDGA